MFKKKIATDVRETAVFTEVSQVLKTLDLQIDPDCTLIYTFLK